MPRNFDQIMRSKEIDIWSKTDGGNNTTGTKSLTVSPFSGRSINYISGVSAFNNVTGAKFEILNGTAYLYQMYLQSGAPFRDSFDPPLKCSVGTSCTFNLYGLLGTVSCNMYGYTVK